MTNRRKYHKKKKKHRQTLFFLTATFVALLISFLISYLTRSNDYQTSTDPIDSVFQKGSAVRKETHNRKNYEKTFRKKDEWQEKYSKILENKEEDLNLKELEIEKQDTNKK